MEVNIRRATRMFFSKSSFEMIYFEAFANSLDASATKFEIEIYLPDRSDLSNLSLKLIDNGVGFDEQRFSKFGKLFEVEETDHKGLGRLVYLCYFDKVDIVSVYNNTHKREFLFDENFNGKSRCYETDFSSDGTTITLTDFNGEKLGKNDYISPIYIKKTLLEKFFMKFYRAAANNKPITVNIRLIESGRISEETITSNDMPEFSIMTLKNQLDLFNKVDLYYSIKYNNQYEKGRVITAIAIDDRSYPVDVISDENFPPNYEMVFLLMSESFRGEVDNSRQNITIDNFTLKTIVEVFRKGISDIIKKNFPQINKQNILRVKHLNETFPHLVGYFDTDEIGYSSYQDVLKKAQDHFFRDQKNILEAKELNDDDYEKSLELSARVLAEYILFRQITLKRLEQLSDSDTEYDLHNIIAPRFKEFSSDTFINDIYSNNIWVLDDKFMSYTTMLSDKEMSKVIEVLTNGKDIIDDQDRPDITLFFSANPKDPNTKVDVVVVELKRLGISAENNSIVEFQLDTRTQKLAEYFDQRIQRMWFYGIVEFDNRYKTHLVNNDFKPLFSAGTAYFRSKRIYTNFNMQQSVIQNAYIMDFKALVEDANQRNTTFMQILKTKFSQDKRRY